MSCNSARRAKTRRRTGTTTGGWGTTASRRAATGMTSTSRGTTKDAGPTSMAPRFITMDYARSRAAAARLCRGRELSAPSSSGPSRLPTRMSARAPSRRSRACMPPLVNAPARGGTCAPTPTCSSLRAAVRKTRGRAQLWVGMETMSRTTNSGRGTVVVGRQTTMVWDTAAHNSTRLSGAAQALIMGTPNAPPGSPELGHFASSRPVHTMLGGHTMPLARARVGAATSACTTRCKRRASPRTRILWLAARQQGGTVTTASHQAATRTTSLLPGTAIPAMVITTEVPFTRIIRTCRSFAANGPRKARASGRET